jgi:FMN-dependent NADH-azoreductase
MDILHISASPKGARSDSLQLADRFLDRYATANPDHTIRHLDVFDDAHNPDFGAVQAFHKFAPIFGEQQTDEGKRRGSRSKP